MALEFTTSLSGQNKITTAIHPKWNAGVITDGFSWPIVIGNNLATSADIYRLGIIPSYVLAAPATTTSGTSTAATYGVCLVYRSTLFKDGLTGDDIQGNRSNIVDVTLTAADASVLTKALPSPTDSKVNALDIYAAIKIGGVYGTFYRVVKDATNAAGTVTFNISFSSGVYIGSGVTGGTADTTALILATNNDYPVAQPLALEIDGRLVLAGGTNVIVSATYTNGSGTVTTGETVYNGIEFWYIKRDSDTTGGIDGRGTYLCRYAGTTSVSLVLATGAATTYSGSSGSGTATIWSRANRAYSNLYNPNAFPADNVADEYPSAVLAMAKVPNTHRVLMFGAEWVIAEDYDRLPMENGLNWISNEWGCSSHFSIVAANGRLYWLDLGKTKRQILMTDGTTVVPVSTQKIRSILDRVTLDINGDVWRIGFIHGAYYATEQTIRWSLYLDDNTVSNFVLELDLVTGDVRGDPQFYPLRVMDHFTFGRIRGYNYVGQYGWSGGIARIGLDNVKERYYDWAGATGTITGSVASSGNTTTTISVTGASFTTAGDGLKGIQCLVWQELDSSSVVVINPTFYHCRISSNTATVLTINYVETMNVVGEVTAVGVALPAAIAAAGWRVKVGVIQAMIGPKWFTSRDDKTKGTFRELSVVHKGQALLAAEYPIRAHAFENFDNQPRAAEYMEEDLTAQQIADTTKFSASFSRPQANPAPVMGFGLVDNNVHRETTSLDIESIILDWNDAQPQGNP
jgi:hypothetical protein